MKQSTQTGSFETQVFQLAFVLKNCSWLLLLNMKNKNAFCLFSHMDFSCSDPFMVSQGACSIILSMHLTYTFRLDQELHILVQAVLQITLMKEKTHKALTNSNRYAVIDLIL